MQKLWRIAFVLALVTTACRAEATLTVTLAEDGSGAYTARVGLDDQLRAALDRAPEPFRAGADELLQVFDFGIAGATSEQTVEGDMTFSVISATFEDVSELSAQINQNLEQNPIERFEVSVDEDGATVDARIVFGEELGAILEQAAALGDQLQFEAAVQIEMPGRVTEQNATRRDGDNVLIWDLDLSQTEIDILAKSTFSEGGFPWWIVLVVLLAAAVLVGWWLWSRSQRGSAVARVEAAASDASEPQGWT